MISYERILHVVIFVYFIFVFDFITRPAVYLPKWWDDPLHDIIFFLFYITVVSILLFSVASQI